MKDLHTHLHNDWQRIMVVTDRHVAEKSGVLLALRENLSDRELTIFDAVEENPSFDVLERGRALARDSKAQLIIAAGGGSPMDAGKGIAVLATNHAPMKHYIDGWGLEADPLPIIAVPTTAGTGSEVTPFAVFTDPEDQAKTALDHPSIFPRIAIVDPELMASMPEEVIVHTGLDALTHAIEAFLSRLASPMTDMIALEAVGIVLDNLKPAWEKNADALSRLAWAATLAGMAIAHTSTILLHVMAYPLTVFHHIPHGKANAILLPAFFDFLKKHATETEKVTRLDGLFQSIGGIGTFVSSLGISPFLGDHGVDADEFPLFMQKAIVKGDVKLTPAAITEKDILDIYQSAN